MKSSLKKLLALCLAAFMLLPLSACATGETDPATKESSTQSQEEVESDNMDYVCELPAELDYNGEEINIMYIKKSGREDELISEGLGNGIIADAVYERNLAVETDLGVKLCFFDQSSDLIAQTNITKLVQAGDTTTDIFTIGTYCSVDPAISGVAHNEYIDLLLNVGLVGTALMLGFFFTSYLTYIKRYRQDRQDHDLCIVMLKTTWILYAFTLTLFLDYRFMLLFLI